MANRAPPAAARPLGIGRPTLLLAWAKVLRRLRWVTHPITVFVFLQIVWLAITLIWVIWFVGEQAEIAQLAQRFGRQYFDNSTAIAILVVGCVLLGVILVGTIVLFVFGQRQSYLIRQQRSFVSSVTHELKSPLASLQLSFETIGSRRLDEQTTDRVLGMIQTDIDRLRRLVDQILIAGRLDRGIGLDDEAHAVNIGELATSIMEKMTYLDPEATKRLVLAGELDLTVEAPRSALSLILGNLLENALKYSPRGSPIEVLVTRTDRGIRISVSDKGLGLTKKDQRRIFRMFHRSDVAVRKAIPGTGLGLYIVRSVTKMLGGKVTAESPGHNQGATFHVDLRHAN